jgi:hypothetical protein
MEATYEKDEEKYTFKLKYELDRVLHIAYMNPNYSKHIISELNKVKLLFLRQQSIGMVFVDYFITSNVILIKSKIVEESVCNNKMIEDTVDKVSKLIAVRNISYTNIYKEIRSSIDELMKLNSNKFPIEQRDYLENAFITYKLYPLSRTF